MTKNTIDHKNIVCHSCGLLYCLSFLWSFVLSVILVVYCIFCHSCGLLYCLSFLWYIVLSVILVVYYIVMTDNTIYHKNDRQYNRPQEWQKIQQTTRMTDNAIYHKNDRQYNRPQESFLWSIVLSVILVVYCIVCHSCGLLYCLSFLWSIVLSVILVDNTIDHKNDRQYNRPQEWQTIQ
jgi:steroid 5-alpha reductase family enzyme